MKRFFLTACVCALTLVACCSCTTGTSYTVTRVDHAPDWSTIPQLDIDNVQWTDDYGIRAHAQLCYDNTNLYVRMWANEQDIRATYTADDPLAKCYEDSCLELFITPEPDDARYLNFEFNPNCACCCEIGTAKTNRVRLIPADNTFSTASSIADGEWEITYRIPFDFIRKFYPNFEAQPNTEIRANLYKCGNLTANKHYLTWNPVNSDTPNFHVPSSFGTLVLE